MMSTHHALLALCASLALCTAAHAQVYKGKTLSLIVGASGGTLDLTARIVARHLPRHLAGEPTVVVKPMPGGATLIAQNYVAEKAPADGSVISFNSFQGVAQLIGDPGMRFAYHQTSVVAAFAEAPYLVLGRTEAIAADFRAAPTATLISGGRRADHVVDAVTVASMDVMGLRHRFVAGYGQGNAGDFSLALGSGEIQLMGATSGQWLQIFAPQQVGLAKPAIAPLWQNAYSDLSGKITRHPAYPEVPTFLEAYRRVHGKDPSGELWEAYRYVLELNGFANFIVFGPPKMNEEATAALREAFAKLASDPLFNAEIAKVQGQPMAYISPAMAQPKFEKLRDTEAKPALVWKERINSQFRR